MASEQTRRKNCLFRLAKHSCPFKRLKKNKCYDIHAVSPPAEAERWAGFEQAPSCPPPLSQQCIAQVVIEPHPSPVTARFAPLGEQYEMEGAEIDVDNVVVPVPAPPSPTLSDSMDMDNDIDPETGERALG